MALLALVAAPAAGDGVPAGSVLGPENAAGARGLLPDEILRRYERGEFRHEVVEAPRGTQWTDPGFAAAAAGNRGRYAVNAAGTIVDPAAGAQPTSIYGPPFPEVAATDPQAGVKLAWNFFYSSYLLGDNRNVVALGWVSRAGIDRELKTEVWQKFYDGQPPGVAPAENPNNLLFQQLVDTQFPADLKGTLSLTWRFRDTTRDGIWTYVPALRRVRAVSPTNRSDGFLGSDMSQDDGLYFDGKPEDFVWRYVGDAEVLCPYDRGAIVDRRADIRELPGGGWRVVFPPEPRFAWQAGRTDLVPWAPLPERMVLVRRPVHVIEAVPRDRYYLYGKLVLRLEQGSYVGCYNSKYDWQGEIMNTYTPLRGAWFEVDRARGLWRPYTAAQFTLSQNFRLDRATVSYPFADDPSTPADSLIPMDHRLFDYQTMVQRGR